MDIVSALFPLACAYTVALASTSNAGSQLPLADCSGHREKKGVCKILRDGHEGWSFGGGH